MAYMKPGFYEVPSGKLVPEMCDNVSNFNDWASQMGKAIDTLGRGGRRVASLGLEDIVAMGGDQLFAPGSERHRDLQHLLLRFLHASGVVEYYPAVVGYQALPQITLDQAVDRMLSAHIKFPTVTDLGGTSFDTTALKSIFPTLIREWKYKRNLRPLYVDRLRRKLGSIAFKLASGQAIDQHERSFFVAFCDPTRDRGWTAEEKQKLQPQGKDGTGGGPNIVVAETGDPLVTATWEDYKQVVEPGPFLRFARLLSNRNFENLLYTFGPQMGALTYEIGYRMRYGDFYEPRVREAVVLPWAPEDQMVSARERYLAWRMPTPDLSIANTPILAAHPAAPNSPTFRPEWDLPNVEMRVNLDQPLVNPTEFSYWSPWRERMVSSIFGATPAALLLDLALTNESVGESQLSTLKLSDFKLVDMEKSSPYLAGQAPVKPQYTERIIVPRNGQADTVSVAMDDFYSRLGTTMFMPAFREYVLAPMSWLHVVDKEAEDFIAARLGLTWEQKLQAEQSIRISHNHAKLSRLLSGPQLPMTWDSVLALCKALTLRS